MSIEDERVSQLLAEIQDQPSPEQAFSKWLFVDIIILDGLMMLFVILFLIIRDVYLVSMVGAFSIAFGAVYLHFKDNRKHSKISGRDFLDSQTIVGDIEVSEQIPVLHYDYVLLPDKTITGKDIAYSRVDIDDSLGTLRTIPTRVGGASALRPEVVDNLVRLRLRELKELEESKRKGNKQDAKESSGGGFFSRFKAQKVKKIPKVTEDTGYVVGDVEENTPIEVEELLDEDDKKTLNKYKDVDIDDILFDDDFGGFD